MELNLQFCSFRQAFICTGRYSFPHPMACKIQCLMSQSKGLGNTLSAKTLDKKKHDQLCWGIWNLSRRQRRQSSHCKLCASCSPWNLTIITDTWARPTAKQTLNLKPMLDSIKDWVNCHLNIFLRIPGKKNIFSWTFYQLCDMVANFKVQLVMLKKTCRLGADLIYRYWWKSVCKQPSNLLIISMSTPFHWIWPHCFCICQGHMFCLQIRDLDS